MRVRKWLVRGLVCTLLVGMGCAAVLYQRWTDPVVVREQVISSLGDMFPGAQVTLEAARLRILGGILLTDLRLIRRDDPTRTDFAYIPSALIYYDKEQLLDGGLACSKVELNRPRVRIIRERDGRWNLADLTASGTATVPLPTLVVHEGTLIFEDRLLGDDFPPLEITGLSLKMINDPLAVAQIEASGTSTILGKIELQATWRRDTGQVTLSLQTAGGELTSAVVRRLARAAGNAELLALEVEGKADLKVDLVYAPDSLQPTPYDIQLSLKNAKVAHPKLPLTVDNLNLEARCTNDRLTVQSLTARSDKTEIEAHGSARLPDLEANCGGSLTLRHVGVCPALCAKLPAEVQNVHQLFQPQGPVTVKFDFLREKGCWLQERCVLQPEKVDLCYVGFPYPVPNLTGTLDMDLLRQTVGVDLEALNGSRKLTLKGTWKGFDGNPAVDLRLQADGLPLDKTVLQALPEEYRDLARSFHATGQADVCALIRRVPSLGQYTNEYHIHFHDATTRWDSFPLMLSQLSGDLHIYPDFWEFHDFHGFHKGGQVSIQGRSVTIPASPDSPAGQRLTIDVAGSDIALDADLRAALVPMPTVARAWNSLHVGGQMNLLARIDSLPSRPLDLDITADVRDGSLEPRFFRYRLANLSGHFHYGKGRLEMTDVQARHGATGLRLERGTVDLSPTGGFYADFVKIEGNPVYPNDGLAAALPHNVRSVLALLEPGQPIAVRSHLIIAQKEEPGSLPDIYWDSLVWVKDTTLKLGLAVDKATGVIGCRGRHDGHELHGLYGHVLLSEATLFNQPFQNVHAKLQIRKETPETLLAELKAPIYGGDVSGQVRVDFHSTLRYEMNLTAEQIDLQKFGFHNMGMKSELSGLASARLHLTGQGSGIASLDGNGTIDIPQGKLLNLPFLLDLLKFLGLRWPDRTAFEEAHAGFAIHGNRLKINRLDLWGNAISLTGQGEVNLDGTDLNLDLFPSWARVEQLLPPAVRGLAPTVSRGLLKIEARGKVGGQEGDLKFLKRPVPVLMEPMRHLWDRVIEIERASPLSLQTN